MQQAVAQMGSRRAWLAWRAEGLGGSDAPAILGWHPYKTPMGVYLEKTGAIESDAEEESAPMRWGRLLEPAMIEEFERQTHYRVSDAQTLHTHPSVPYLRATVDGVVIHNERAVGLLETKTTSVSRDSWEDGVPDYIEAQVMHQLAVTGASRAWVALLRLQAGLPFQVHEVTRDEGAIEDLLALEADFWQRILERRPPPTDGRDVDAMRAAYAHPQRAEVEVDSDVVALIAERQLAKAREKAGAARTEEIEARLMQVLADAEVATYQGERVASWKALTQKRVDLDRLRAAHPALVGEFTEEIAYRRWHFPQARAFKGVNAS